MIDPHTAGTCLPYYTGLQYTGRRWYRHAMCACMAMTLVPFTVALLFGLRSAAYVPREGAAVTAPILTVAGGSFVAALVAVVVAVVRYRRATKSEGSDEADVAALRLGLSGLGCCVLLPCLVWAALYCLAPRATTTNVHLVVPWIVVVGFFCLCSCCGFTGVGAFARDGESNNEKLPIMAGLCLLCLFLALVVLQVCFAALKLDGTVQWPWRVVFTPAWIVEAAAMLLLCVSVPATLLIPKLTKGDPLPEEGHAVLQIGTSICLCLFLPPTIFQVLLCLQEQGQLAGGASSPMAGFWVASPVVLGWGVTMLLVILCRVVSYFSPSERFMRLINEQSEDDFCKELLEAGDREERVREERDARMDRDARLLYMGAAGVAEAAGAAGTGRSGRGGVGWGNGEAGDLAFVVGGGGMRGAEARGKAKAKAVDRGVQWVEHVATMVNSAPALQTDRVRGQIEAAVFAKQRAGLWGAAAQRQFRTLLGDGERAIAWVRDPVGNEDRGVATTRDGGGEMKTAAAEAAVAAGAATVGGVEEKEDGGVGSGSGNRRNSAQTNTPARTLATRLSVRLWGTPLASAAASLFAQD